jgi:hypothetical protein
MIEAVESRSSLSSLIWELGLRVQDKGVLPFEKDFFFVTSLMDRMDNLHPESRKRGYEALDRLVPKRGHDGCRIIAGRRISPKVETLISSRINAQETDNLSPDKAFASLPKKVRELIQTSGNFGISLEMTDRCTVQCDFCGVADKGNISGKVSFESILGMIELFHHDSYMNGVYATKTPSDSFYWGTDPFDARWLDATGEDLDYVDIIEGHRKICGITRAIYTSTAIPIGEELRVAAALMLFIEGRQKKSISTYSGFRISVNNSNKIRAEAVQTLIEAIYQKPVADLGVEISPNRSKDFLLAGEKVTEPTQVTMADVIGVNCMDGIIVGPGGIDVVIMAGTSSEIMSGEIRIPFSEVHEDGAIEYRVPRYYFKPRFSSDDDPKSYYPDPQLSLVVVFPDGRMVERVDVLRDNPYRTHVRVAAILSLRELAEKDRSRKKIKELRELISNDVSLMRRHLKVCWEATGKRNIMMEQTCILALDLIGRD